MGKKRNPGLLSTSHIKNVESLSMGEITANAVFNRLNIENICHRLITGEISYEQAKMEAKPIIAKMNARGAEISRESGVKYKPLSFAGLMR